MLTYVESSLFDSPAQTLVNTVNTVGVMGKGVALTFREIFPEMFAEYQRLCEQGALQIGGLHLYRGAHKYVLNFPTKKHWRNPSKPEYIEAGLRTLVANYQRWGITSLSMPPLGCGNGALDYDTQVRPLVERYLSKLSIPVFVHLYAGGGGRPEHAVPEATRAWLRTVPHDLSFWEVWDDLKEVVQWGQELRTAERDTRYTAEVVEMVEETGDPALRIQTSGKRFLVHFEELRSLWVQLRSFGYITSSDAPANLMRSMSYLAPIFAQLPYIQSVRLSEDYSLMSRRPAWGLMYRRPDGEQHESDSLFDPSPMAELRLL
jgi:O-acetyl-ADP-ribose deacetylase (regulator of RNase III)